MKHIFSLVSLIILTACMSQNELYHGYTFNDVRNLNQTVDLLQKQGSSRSDVERLLGTPTLIEAREDLTCKRYSFFYVEDVFKRAPIIGNKKSHSRILRVDFSCDGRVERSRFFKVEGNGSFNTKLKTEAVGESLGFFEQMQKNFGVK